MIGKAALAAVLVALVWSAGRSGRLIAGLIVLAVLLTPGPSGRSLAGSAAEALGKGLEK